MNPATEELDRSHKRVELEVWDSLLPLESSQWLDLHFDNKYSDTEWTVRDDKLSVAVAHKEQLHGVPGNSSPGLILPLSIPKESTFPEYLSCAIRIDTKNGSVVYPALYHWRWFDDGFFDVVDQHMQRFVNQQGPRLKRSYKTTGRLSLFRQNAQGGFKEVASCTIETKRDWKRQVPMMIIQNLKMKPLDSKVMFLELRTDFEWFEINSTFGINVQSVKNVLDETVQHNFLRQPFWSRKTLAKLFDRDTIRAVVKEDSQRWQIPYSGSEIQNFCDWLENDLYHLLAAAIRSNNKISDLYKLWSDEKCESVDTLTYFEEAFVRKFLSDGDPFLFTTTWGFFRPVNFPESGDFKVKALQDKQVVPLNYDKGGVIGEGAFGRVYKVKIHSDFHNFSSNRNETFAMKVMERSVPPPKKAQEEVEIWKYLVREPHDHIARFHTAWIQRNCFYILSPLASGDLDQYMREHTFDFKNDTKHLLKQLEGVTSAIQRIHHIGRAGLKHKPAIGKRVDFGYHHDLKPSNILIFEDGTWKVSDFGTAKLHHAMSGSAARLSPRTSNLAAGDPVYGAPDYYVMRDPNKGIGQEYDIWSLGCIILEVVTWMFPGSDLDDFRTKRSQENHEECAEGSSRQCPCEDKRSKNSYKKKEEEGKDRMVHGNLPSGKQRKIVPGDLAQMDNLENFWFWCSPGQWCHRKVCVDEQLKLIEDQAWNSVDDQQSNEEQQWDGHSQSQAVSDVLNDSQNEQKRPYRWMYGIFVEVRQMLECNPGKRPKASSILDTLGKLRVKAEVIYQDSSTDSQPGSHSLRGFRVNVNGTSCLGDRDDREGDLETSTIGRTASPNTQGQSRKRKRGTPSMQISSLSPSNAHGHNQLSVGLPLREQDSLLVQTSHNLQESADLLSKKMRIPTTNTPPKIRITLSDDHAMQNNSGIGEEISLSDDETSRRRTGDADGPLPGDDPPWLALEPQDESAQPKRK